MLKQFTHPLTPLMVQTTRYWCINKYYSNSYYYLIALMYVEHTVDQFKYCCLVDLRDLLIRSFDLHLLPDSRRRSLLKKIHTHKIEIHWMARLPIKLISTSPSSISKWCLRLHQISKFLKICKFRFQWMHHSLRFSQF